MSLHTEHVKQVHLPVSNKDSRQVGILRRPLVENVEKHGMISRNLKKHRNKNGVLWSQARMRIEMKLKCYLVSSNW